VAGPGLPVVVLAAEVLAADGVSLASEDRTNGTTVLPGQRTCPELKAPDRQPAAQNPADQALTCNAACARS
jgi:hypothetical protein